MSRLFKPMRSITWAGHEFDLFPAKGMFHASGRTLIVADTHFGKAAAFRSGGIPVPEGGTHADLRRLSLMIEQSGAERLMILGDFLHAREGRVDAVMSSIESWRSQHSSLDTVVVRGNHDQHAGDPPTSWNVSCVDEPFIEGNLAFRHVPCDEPDEHDLHQIAGHVHPCAMLRDIDGSSMRSPCFYFSNRTAILPAFGSFTGTHPIRPRIYEVKDGKAKGVVGRDRIFAVGADEVIEVRHARVTRA